MNGATGAKQRGHGELQLLQPDRPVVYDPKRLSPGAIDRIVRTAAYLCASVEGLDVAPGIDQATAAKVLQEPLLRMKRELVAAGAIVPLDQVRN